MFFKRKATPNNPSSVDGIVIHDLAALEGMDGGMPPGHMVKRRYVVTRHEAALSRKVLSVKPGDMFVFETDVRLERPALATEKDPARSSWDRSSTTLRARLYSGCRPGRCRRRPNESSSVRKPLRTLPACDSDSAGHGSRTGRPPIT